MPTQAREGAGKVGVIEHGGMEKRRHQDNPAAATICLPREGEQGSGESQINLFVLFLFFFFYLPLCHRRVNPQWRK